ncbi:Serine transporter [Kluyvera cryocrescens]|uniref:Serine transporter n=1 Tax=Kluyvera cryocrescens TaxID=580 RepID=A0A485CRM6_KLUCR|nr:Serine transporter [Kluyvera cryocrescens]
MDQKKITIWMMVFYGATVGAGTLFLPVEIGTRGPLIFLMLLLLAIPLALVPHVLICRVFMRDRQGHDQADQTLPLFGSFFGTKGRQAMKLFFCVAHYPVTLVYAVSLINALSHFLTERLHVGGIHRGSLTLIVLLILHIVLSKGRDKVVSTLSALALPFAIAIIAHRRLPDPGLELQQYFQYLAADPIIIGWQLAERFVVNPAADCIFAMFRPAYSCAGFLVPRTGTWW